MLGALGATPFALNNFEGLVNGKIFDLGQGVTATYSGVSDADAGVRATGNVQTGFNTTFGGRQFFEVAPAFDLGNVTLNFTKPINFFGGFFSAVESECGTVTAGWATKTFDLLDTRTGGSCNEGTAGVQWFGFIAPAAFSHVSFTVAEFKNSLDSFAMDDIIWGNSLSSSTTTPEPSTWVLMLSGLGMVALASRRRRSRSL
ncbi:MAG: PEP-CTERM sorting domain-containing protein [Gemmatimonadaceae bacterium]